MSRAFVKEDIEVPERITRRRSASGLPPGALNLMTAEGVRQLQTRLDQLTRTGGEKANLSQLKNLLDSVTRVEPQDSHGNIVFGSTVTLCNTAGDEVRYCITGVDEVDMDPGNVSWVSPLGKALLEVRLGQKLHLPESAKTLWTVVRVD